MDRKEKLKSLIALYRDNRAKIKTSQTIEEYYLTNKLYEEMDKNQSIFEKIEKWGEDRNFFNPEHGTTAEKQYLKLAEEVGEIAGDLARGRDVKDSIGDSIVVLVGLAKLCGTSIEECAEFAYNEIKDRKGEMRNGVFIKESDLT